MRRILALCALAFASLLPAFSATAQTSASNFTTGYRYDEMRRLTGTISPRPDATSTIRYAAVRNTYDAAGRLTKVEKGELATWQDETIKPSLWTGFTIFQSVETTYDSMNRKLKDVTKSGATSYTVTQYSYDAVGRPECTAVRMNSTVFGSLPASACTLGTTGTQGPDRITRNVYDAASQLIQVRKAVGTTSPNLEQAYSTYSYTLNGQREYVIDANGNRAKLGYDGFDRQIYWYFPSTTRPSAFNGATQATALSTAGEFSATDYEQYGYDANGNRTSLRKRSQQGQPAGSQTLGYSYDALNRMSVKDVPGSTAADVYYGYDLRGLQLYARYVSTAGQGVSSAYDNTGRLTQSTINLGGTSRSLFYQYDADGNRTRLNYPDYNGSNDRYFTYEFDGLNRMMAIKQSGSTTVATIGYNNRGERRCWYANSSTDCSATATNKTGYTYDTIGRLASIGHDLSGTAQDVTYCMGTVSGSCTPSYNAANQVMARTVTNDAYALSQLWNASRGYAANGLNQYTTAGASGAGYDLNGNLTSYAGTTYAYDIENRLTSATGATSATLNYDPLGRLYETAGATTTRFLYDGDALVAEYDAAGTLQRRYVHGPGIDEPLLWYEGAAFTTKRVLRSDHQGSIVSVADNLGASVAINAYDEWGVPATGNVGRFAYTGQIIIPELGMYHYKARVYAPRLGRFLQTDPVGYDDQINLYSYALNDPSNNSDPTGMVTGTGAKETNGEDCDSDPQCTTVGGLGSGVSTKTRFQITLNVAAGGGGSSAAIDLGHAWITILDNKTGETSTFSVYMDGYGPENGPGNDIRKDFSSDKNHFVSESLTAEVPKMRESSLNALLKSNITYNEYRLNCADFALIAWRTGTGQSISATNFIGISTPLRLYEEIKKIKLEARARR